MFSKGLATFSGILSSSLGEEPEKNKDKRNWRGFLQGDLSEGID